jgi:cell division inhibitor SepF
MSALHRLKAYFGMVPAEEFDAEEFDAAHFDTTRFDATRFDATEFSTTELDGYHPGYRSSYSGSSHSSSSGRNHLAYAHQAHDSVPDRAAANLRGERPYISERSATRRPPRVGGDDHDDGFPAQTGDYAAPRVHAPRSPSAPAVGAQGRSSRTAEPWGADVPVRGSLAIDTSATDAPRVDNRPSSRQPMVTPPFAHEPQIDPLDDDEAYPLSRIVTLHPHSYNEARPIGERYREGNPVIMNLTAMEDRDAKRLVDFAAGLAFALRGSIDKVTNKVFLLSPANVDVSAEDRRRIAEGRLFT